MWSSYLWLEEFPKYWIEDAFAVDMDDMAEVLDSCNIVLVGGYEQEDVIDAMDLTCDNLPRQRMWTQKSG